MQNPALERFQTAPRTPSRVALCLVVTVIVLAISVFTFVQIDRELERNRTVQSDNRTWVLAQIQVDLQNLQISLLQAAANPDPAALDDLRLAYDILYSRVHVVNNTPNLQELSLHGTPAWQAFAAEGGLVGQLMTSMDGPDQALRAALPEMIRKTEEISFPVREMIVVALGESMTLGDATRQNLQRTLYSFMAAIVATLLGLALLFATVYRQSRAQQDYARHLELAVRNLRATIESAPDAVLIVNADDMVIGANASGEAMLGCTTSPSTPIALSDILPGHAQVMAAMGTKAQLECHGCDGQTVPVEVSIADVSTGAGDRFKIAFLRDMTQQLDRERQLAKASELARKGEEAKDRFLAVMSHEMRTPLSGLLSATDLLETTTVLDEPQTWLVGILKSCGQAALEQVNNILELTRLSAADTKDYPLTDFCINEMVREQVNLYQALALDRGNTLTLSPENAPPCMVNAPMPLLRRILNNLLSNAIKFTRNGSIDVALQARPAAQPGMLHFTMSIRDTGIGIAEADLERIFHNFETLDSSYSRVQEGTGLGLGIAKLSAEALGGTVRVDSKLGEGTCFTVTFEVAAVQEPASIVTPVDTDPQRRRSLTILLAEDNDINRVLMERQITRLGHRVVTAIDGIEAIEAAARERFDIILMDISMPRMDGLTATRHLIDQGLVDGIPVIALTAQASPDKVQELCAIGMADVVIKPVPMARLDEIMHDLVASQGKRPEKPEALPSSALLDRDRLEELIEVIGVDELGKLAHRFRADMEGSLVACKAALSAGNRKDLSKVVHKVAGAAGMLTMDALCTALREMETATASETTTQLQDRYQTIKQLQSDSLGALQAALKAA